MTDPRSTKPEPSEHLPYYARYIALVPDGDVVATLERQLGETLTLLRGVNEATACMRHPPYTWSIKEVLGHVTDGERVFGYRALCVARGDQTPLPGFDENAYVRVAAFDALPLPRLLEEYEYVRRSVVSMFRNLPDEAWMRKGTANGDAISVRALAYIIAGHERHHSAILAKRLGRG